MDITKKFFIFVSNKNNIMSWQVSTKIEEGSNEPKYRIWSTVTDSYITEWETREKILWFLFWHNMNKFMDGVIEHFYTFPGTWTDKETGHRISTSMAMVDDYMKARYSNLNDEETFIKTFLEIIEKLGIKLYVSDGKYIIHNTEINEVGV